MTETVMPPLPRQFDCGPLRVRPMPMRLDKVGDEIEGHAHEFDHMSQVLYGAALFRWLGHDGRVREVMRYGADSVYRDSRCHILIEAGWRHTIIAKAPNTIVWCLYPHRSVDGEICEVCTGWETAYEVAKFPTDRMLDAGVGVLRKGREAVISGKQDPVRELARKVFEAMLEGNKR